MAKSEKFNASVNFGAQIDPSMGKVIDRLTGGILDIESTTEKAMKVQAKWVKDMEAGGSTMADKISTVTKAMSVLENKQKSLQRAMHDAQKEGKDISDMAMDYGRMAHGIEQAKKELESLNKEQEKTIRSAKRREAMLGPTKELMAKIHGTPGRVLDSMAAGIGRLPYTAARGAVHATKWAALGSLGLAGGAIGGSLALMDKMTEDVGLAKSYGMTYEKFKTGGILATRAGLNAENFGDLTEELSNKIGEQGNEKTINPMLGQLGMTKNMLAGLSKGKQFDKVMQAITSKVQAGSITKVQGESLADQLMGGEANKLVTYILETGKTYEEAMKDASKLQNTTNEEAEGAAKTSRVLSDLWISGESALEGVVGDIGMAIAPQLQALENTAIGWIKDNKKTISNAIDDWVKSGGPKRFIDDAIELGKGIGLLAEEIIAVADKLGFLLPEARKPEEMNTPDEAYRRATEIATKQAEEQGLGIFDKIQMVNKAADEGRKAWYESREVARVPDYVGFEDNAMGISTTKLSSQDTYHINPTFNITMQPDQSPQDVSNSIMDAFNKMVPNFSPAPTFDTY